MSLELSLRPYQVADLAFYMSHPRCANLSCPGTGKTPSVCVYLGWLWQTKRVRTIWVMPKSLLKKNWRETVLWSGLTPADVVIVDGPPARREKQMQQDGKVFIMGFDCFGANWEQLVEMHPDIDALVGDEWHMGFKSNSSQRTQSMYKFMERSTYFIAMTGTIIDGRLDSAYPFIQVVEPTAYISGWYGFKMAHAIENDYGQIVDWRDPGRIGAIFGRHAIRHSFEEAYGPEAKVIVHELCEMDPLQRQHYAEFEEQALLELEDSWIDGSLPGVNAIRCRQLMEHPQTFGDPLSKIAFLGKEERLKVHLEDHKNTGKPLIIFGALTPQHDRLVEICNKMGFRTAMIDGRVSGARRDQIDLDFQAGEIDILIASAATAGVGFNWGHVDHIIFISLDYMDSSFVQAYRRAIRGRRTSPLLITVMEYENSVDQKIFAIVERKSKLAHDVDETVNRVKLRASRPTPQKLAVTPTFKMSDFDFRKSSQHSD